MLFRNKASSRKSAVFGYNLLLQEAFQLLLNRLAFHSQLNGI